MTKQGRREISSFFKELEIGFSYAKVCFRERYIMLLITTITPWLNYLMIDAINYLKEKFLSIKTWQMNLRN